jgi:hypothetical protein
MANDKLRGFAYYLGALSTFATFLGTEAYSHVACEKAGLEGRIESVVMGIPAAILIPMGIYCIRKSARYFMNDKKCKK